MMVNNLVADIFDVADNLLPIILSESINQRKDKTRIKSRSKKGMKWRLPTGTQSFNTETQKEREEGDLLFIVVAHQTN